MIEITCLNCGKKALKKQSEMCEKTFCCRKCYNEWRRERKGTVKKCEECGKKYRVETYRANESRFCSIPCLNRCNARNNRKGPPKICRACGKEFYGDRVTCSKKCALVKFGRRIEKECEGCGKTMRLLPSRCHKRFCSRDCHAKWRTGRRRKEPLTKTCLICKSVFTVRPSKENIKYCKACDGRKHEDAYDRPTGEAHPFFLRTKTKQYGRNWQEQARRARRRDGNRCVCCGKKHTFFSRLPVHHIIPRRLFPTLKELEQKGNALSNLATLCPSCHIRAERGTISKRELRELITPA